MQNVSAREKMCYFEWTVCCVREKVIARHRKIEQTNKQMFSHSSEEKWREIFMQLHRHTVALTAAHPSLHPDCRLAVVVHHIKGKVRNILENAEIFN